MSKYLGNKPFSNGDKYEGELIPRYDDTGFVAKEEMCGEGTMVYNNGNQYKGNWRNDKRHGKGTCTYADGGRFVGDWEDDKKHGKGIMYWASGAKYEGRWRNDKREGKGTLTYSNSRKNEEQYFKNDESQWIYLDSNVTYHYVTSRSKYGFRSSLAHSLSSRNADISIVHSRTGSGKTLLMADTYLKFLENDMNTKNACVFVPNHDKHLLEGEGSVHEQINNFLEEQNSDVKVKVINNIKEIKKFEKNNDQKYIFLLSFCDNRKSCYQFVKNLTDKIIFIDEFDKTQTQFGLSHFGNRNFSKGRLKSLSDFIKRERDSDSGSDSDSDSDTDTDNEQQCKYGFLDPFKTMINNKNKVILLSATNDQVITSDFLPYYGHFSCHIVNVHHEPIENSTRDQFLNNIIRLTDKQTIKNKIFESKKGDLNIVYCSNTRDAKKLKRKLINRRRELIIRSFFGKDSSLNKDDAKEELNEADVIFFVNRGTRGLNPKDTNINIFIYRPLNDTASSTRPKNDIDAELKELISNIFVQIMGRGGRKTMPACIYKLSKFEHTTDTDKIIQKISQLIDNPKSKNIIRFSSKINRINNLHGNHIASYAKPFRTYILSCLFNDYFNDNKRGRPNILIKKITEEFRHEIDNFRQNLKDRYYDTELFRCDDDDLLISEYLYLETNIFKVMKDHFAKVENLTQYWNNIINISVKNVDKNTTGGYSESRLSISNSQKALSVKACMETFRQYKTNSFFFKNKYYETSDKIDDHEFIHIKQRKSLDNSQITKAKYAIPVRKYRSLENSLHHIESDEVNKYKNRSDYSEQSMFKNLTTINYENLKKYTSMMELPIEFVVNLHEEDMINKMLKSYQDNLEIYQPYIN